ncbi:PAS domain S-box protein [Spirosoma pollinicola]|uniref:histidine kinase n=1 Tax=Spirosoma pollinicola TaxID=2057025 RepID=A0A2K8YTX6_9BACT|nr:PAS domain S-box protein [Spirosoma pollinicola]AUD01024.1 hypothetical protein CWM47_03810 [Spirosoma pollinicola]
MNQDRNLFKLGIDNYLQGIAIVKPVSCTGSEITGFCCQYVNPAFARILAKSTNQLIGQPIGKLFSNETDTELINELQYVYQTGEPRQWLHYDQGRCLGMALLRVDEQVMISLQDVSEQKRVEHDLKRRLEMEAISSRILHKLLNLDDYQLDNTIVDALEQVGLHIGAGRASVFLYSDDYQRGSCNYEWCAPTMPSQKSAIQQVPVTQFGWTYRQVEQGKLIHVTVDQLPPEAGQEKAILTKALIYSMTLVPLVHQGKVQGFIGFYTVKETHTWDNHDVSLLETLATLLTSLLQRLKKETAFVRANQRLEGLNEIDKALLSYRLNNQSPLSIAMKYLQFMVPFDRLTILRLDADATITTVHYTVTDGTMTVCSDETTVLSIPGFQDQFPQPDDLFDYPDLQIHAGGLSDTLDLYTQGFRSALLIPLFYKQECIGAFLMASISPYFFTEEYSQIARELTGSLSMVLYQQQLTEQINHQTNQLTQQIDDRKREISQLSNLHKAILKHAGQAIISTNHEGIIQTANQACAELLGFEIEELIGRTTRFERDSPESPLKFVTYKPDDPTCPPLNNNLDELTAQGYFICECDVVGLFGQRIPALLTTSSLHDEDGILLGYVGIATDISALKTVEARLHSTNQRLELATQAACQGIWEVDMETNLLSWDDRVWEIYGMEPSQTPVEFPDFLALIHPDDLPDFMDRFQHDLDSGSIANVTRIIRPDGAVRYVQAIGHVIYDRQGKPIRQIGIIWDITAQKEAERAIQESEQRFREIAENVDELFWVHQADPFKLLYVNPAFERLWHMNPHSPEKKLSSLLKIIEPEDHTAVLALIDQYKAGQEGQLYFRLIITNQPIRWLFVRTFIIRDASGKVIRHIGIANDVTIHKEKELILEKALLREQDLNQLKSQFVSTASHEFRTPLATIQSSADLIKLYLDMPFENSSIQVKKHLAVIDRQIEQFNILLTDILTIGTIESGNVKFKPTWVDIKSVCQEIITTHFSQSNQDSVQLVQEGTPHPVFLDEKLIRNVLVNLLSNAVKFSNTRPCLRICFEHDRLLLEVKDEGIGIPAKDISNLFQAFYRASNTNAIPGTGLGLVITRQFIDLHKGHLDIQSVEKKGTTCTVTLPIKQAYEVEVTSVVHA